MPTRNSNSNKTVYITGANGYIGSHLVNYLKSKGVNCIIRGSEKLIHLYGDPNHSLMNNEMSFANIVIHLSGITNYKKNYGLDKDSYYELINVTQTKNLILRAARQGVKRFIYISTIKVYGEFSYPGKKISILDEPSPKNIYALSKYSAELKLQEIALKEGLELIIIRSPIVYGPLSTGNFMSLVRLVDSGIPLPFANFQNRRSMIYIENLINYIFLCLYNENVSGKTILVSDGINLQLNEIVLAISHALRKKVNLFSVSPKLAKKLLTLLRLHGLIDRLVMPFEIDINETTNLLGWKPKIETPEGISRSLERYGYDYV